MRMPISQNTAAKIAFLLAIGCSSVTVAAAPLKCLDELYKPQRQTTQTTQEKQAEAVAIEKSKVEANVQELNQKLSRPLKLRTQVRVGVGLKFYDVIIKLLNRINGHAYPFTFIRTGIAQKARFYIRTNDEGVGKEFGEWIHRYESYTSDRAKLIERTAIIKMEVDLLAAIKDRPASDFPVDVTLVKRLTPAEITEKVKFHSPAEVDRYLATLRRTERLHLDGFFKNASKGRFLIGRNKEQAQMEQELRILLAELYRFSEAFGDTAKRSELISKLESILNNPELQAPPAFRLGQIRRMASEEFQFYVGLNRQKTGAGDAAESQLRKGDQIDLGSDIESLGLWARARRLYAVTLPAQLIAAGLATAVPAGKDYVKEHVFTGLVMHEIAQMPQAQYEANTRSLLRDVYEMKYENGRWILNEKGERALAKIQTLRAEHLRHLQQLKISQESFSQMVNTPVSEVSRAEFDGLMKLPRERFLKEAARISSRESSPADSAETLSRLFNAREAYEADVTNNTRERFEEAFDQYLAGE